jgi:hypothetical protein
MKIGQLNFGNGYRLARWLLLPSTTLITYGLLAATQQFESTSLLVLFLTFFTSTLLSQIAMEFPRGNELALIRLAISVSLRTGFPLLVVMLVESVALPGFLEQMIKAVVAFYGVSIVMGVLLSLITVNQKSIDHPDCLEADSVGMS